MNTMTLILRNPLIKLGNMRIFTLACIISLISCISIAQSNIKWEDPTDVAGKSYGNFHPRIVTDGSGNPLILWNHNNRAMFSKLSNNTFTTPVVLNPSNIGVAGAEWMGPDIASKGDTVYVVYKRIPEASDTCNIFVVHSYYGGASFSTPVKVDNILDSISRFPAITTDDNGNPIVGFMKFNPDFGDSRWVVARSGDYGNSFSKDVKASGWSQKSSTVCDCCPGAIASSGNYTVLAYRDNKSNIRDTWAGISTDNGNSFSSGMNIDKQSWNIFSCPATGPDAVIIGDTLYSTFMSSADGKDLVYLSKSSLSNLGAGTGIKLTGSFSGLTVQNYPRLATNGKSLAFVWKQRVNWTDQCILKFTDNMEIALSENNELVDISNITNADVALSDNKVFVVWEDDVSGTVRFRQGLFENSTTQTEPINRQEFKISPNPAVSEFSIKSRFDIEQITVFNSLGKEVFSSSPNQKETSVQLIEQGLYFVQIRAGKFYEIHKMLITN